MYRIMVNQIPNMWYMIDHFWLLFNNLFIKMDVETQ